MLTRWHVKFILVWSCLFIYSILVFLFVRMRWRLWTSCAGKLKRAEYYEDSSFSQYFKYKLRLKILTVDLVFGCSSETSQGGHTN
jgi:hypothetical protein